MNQILDPNVVRETIDVSDGTKFQRQLLQQWTFGVWLKRLVFNHSNHFFALMRMLAPISIHIPWIMGGRLTWIAIITRAENVRDVLNNNAIFKVPYKSRLEFISRSGFLLGQDDSHEHHADLSIATKAFLLSDIPSVARFAAERAELSLANHERDLDVIAGLARPVLTETCCHYLGISPAHEDFPYWAMAVSAYLIAPLDVKDEIALGQAKAGARLVSDAIGRSRVSGETALPGLSKTVMARLEEQNTGDGPTGDLICGVIAAIIPTGILAIGHIIEVLLRRRDMMTAAQEAARSGDADLLRRCLFEALRFKPVIPVWPRVCADNFRLAVDGRWSSEITAKTLVLVSTQSAMRDPRQVSDPGRFSSGRPASNYLHFGAGLHACLGAAIASAIIPAILGPLLRHKTISAGIKSRSFYAAVFPDSFPVIVED